MPMRKLIATMAAFLALTVGASAQPVTIRAGTILDGKGGAQRNAVITIDGAKIARIGAGTNEPVAYDFSRLTVLPGMIDTHVHLVSHFGKDGRAETAGETPGEQALYDAEMANVVLMAGFHRAERRLAAGCAAAGCHRAGIARPAPPDLGLSADRHEADDRPGPAIRPQIGRRRRGPDQDLRL